MSDHHFGHENMLKFKRLDGSVLRNFPSILDHDEYLIQAHNKLVKAEDHVYCMGDFAFRKEHIAIAWKLNGKKRLIMGNHDIYEPKVYLDAGFEKLLAFRKFDNSPYLFTHIPMHPLSVPAGKFNVHGHIHERPAYGPQYMNVSAEAVNYQPVSLEEIGAYFAVKK